MIREFLFFVGFCISLMLVLQQTEYLVFWGVVDSIPAACQ